jgi:hypothetical protein
VDSRYEEQAEPRGWFERLHLIWPMLFLIGWVLYELTTQPMVGAVAVCLKFGWEDFCAAIWLRRVDPRRLRGRACFWLYLASGLAKTAVVAGVMSFAFVAISPNLGNVQLWQRWAAVMEMAGWTCLVMLTGLVCSMLALGYSSILARLGGFRLWLSRDMHRARRRNHWPPYEENRVGSNRLAGLLFIILFAVFLPLYLGSVIATFVALIKVIPAGPGDFLLILGTGVLVSLLVGGPIFLLRLKEKVKFWVATHPCEYWNDIAAESVDAEGMVEMSGNPIK